MLSQKFQQLVTAMPAENRGEALAITSRMSQGWAEEVGAKNDYWQDFDYLFFGIWPNDGESRRIGQEQTKQ